MNTESNHSSVKSSNQIIVVDYENDKALKYFYTKSNHIVRLCCQSNLQR